MYFVSLPDFDISLFFWCVLFRFYFWLMSKITFACGSRYIFILCLCVCFFYPFFSLTYSIICFSNPLVVKMYCLKTFVRLQFVIANVRLLGAIFSRFFFLLSLPRFILSNQTNNSLSMRIRGMCGLILKFTLTRNEIGKLELQLYSELSKITEIAFRRGIVLVLMKFISTYNG